MIHAILLMLVMIGSVGCILMGYSALARLVEGIDDSRKEHTIVSFEWGASVECDPRWWKHLYTYTYSCGGAVLP